MQLIGSPAFLKKLIESNQELVPMYQELIEEGIPVSYTHLRILECTGLYRGWIEMSSDTNSVATVGEYCLLYTSCEKAVFPEAYQRAWLL